MTDGDDAYLYNVIKYMDTCPEDEKKELKARMAPYLENIRPVRDYFHEIKKSDPEEPKRSIYVSI